MTAAGLFLAGAAVGGLAVGSVAYGLIRERAARYGRLFSFAMHELNTPVTAINMTVISLLSGVFGELPDETKRWIEMTRDQLGRLNALVGEVRDLVHLDLQRDLRVLVEPVSPAEIVESALASLRRGYALAGIDLQVQVEKDLPKVRTDADRVSRSLMSLLYYARKFRLGGPVSLSVRRAGAKVSCEIVYTGPSVTPAQVRDSLDVYYIARRRDDQVLPATGLGLGLMREVMRRIGAELEFIVDGDGRSTLLLTLPVEEAS